MNEFDVIEKYFLPLTQGRPESGQLKDDAATLNIPPGYALVVTSDTLNAGTHFLENETPANIAHKALRVNLSDIAAMGAMPYAYQLCIAFPEKPSEKFLSALTDALLNDQKEFGIFCSGGDTTSINGPLSISITAFGLVPDGCAIKRSNAQDGDTIILTGPLGDAYIGLQILQQKIQTPDNGFFISKYQKPTPRTALVKILQKYVHAAIDISDGLVADLNHICRASNLQANIRIDDIQFSVHAESIFDPITLLTAGDDYELLLTVPQDTIKAVITEISDLGLQPQIIGDLTKGLPEAIFKDGQGKKMTFLKQGFSHF